MVTIDRGYHHVSGSSIVSDAAPTQDLRGVSTRRHEAGPGRLGQPMAKTPTMICKPTIPIA